MFNIQELVQHAGVIGALVLIGLTIAAEAGLLIGLLLPGDTLVVVAGFFVAQGRLPLGWAALVIFVGAVLGDNIGYFIGQKAGARLLRRRNSWLLRHDYLARAQAFHERHGGKTVLIARFVPYARTLAPMIAGAAQMRRAKFFIYNMLGALGWTIAFLAIGYWVGSIKNVDRYLVPTIIVVLIFAPAIWNFTSNLRARRLVRKPRRSN